MMTANSASDTRIIINILDNSSLLAAVTDTQHSLTFDCVFHGIADIHGLRVIGRHQTEQTVHQIGHVLERTGLLAVTVNL